MPRYTRLEIGVQSVYRAGQDHVRQETCGKDSVVWHNRTLMAMVLQ